MPFDYLKALRDQDEENEDGQQIVPQPLPVAVSQPDFNISSPDSYKIQNPMVQDYIKKLYGDKFSDDARQKLVQEQNDAASGPNVLAALSALGAGLQGKDAAAAGADFSRRQAEDRAAPLKQFDQARSGLLENQKLNNVLRDDAMSQEKMSRENDPMSLDSQLAQTLAAKMLPGKDFSKMSASQINGLLPTLKGVFDVEQRKLDRQEARQDKLAAKTGGATEGQKAADKDYAKDYNDWTSTGKSILEKNLQALKEARDALKNDKSLTGGLTGVLGDRFTSDKVLQQRQKVGSAIQSSLKATLGSQFTEKEGERILKNAYNEAASPMANIASLDALIKQLETQGNVNDAKASHFEQNGTLRGFAASPSKSAPKTVRLKAPDGSVREFDPNDTETINKYLKKGATRV